MRTLLLILTLALSTAAQTAPASAISDGTKAAVAIASVLGGQVNAWNRHDLEAFMSGYWNSPDLT